MKIAVVTGASYGIGKAIAAELLQEGYKVYGLSRSQPSFSGQKFIWLQCDLSVAEQIQKCTAQIKENTVEVLVSNARVVFTEAASVVTREVYDKTFSVNVLAPMLLVAALRTKLKRATIISTSSVSDRLPDPSIALYCSSKAANTSFFNSLALDLAEAKIYTLLPDFVDTPMLRKDFADDESFNWSVIIKPADIARFTMELIQGKHQLASGTNIIIVTNALEDSLKSREKLYGYNTETHKLTQLRAL